ncbi:hypothetical protein [Azospirillum formosense]|uniref:hypothetical protein n=1 Tax=Azospirillum formosense TaxID=861533 RepID=UPI00338F00DD
MALHKEINTEFGVPAAYHRVASVQIYYLDRCCDVYLSGYLSAEARGEAKSPMLSSQTRLSFDALGLRGDGEPTRAAIYDALKSMPEFAGAIDV